MKYFGAGCVFWGIVAFIIYAVRPSAALSREPIKTIDRKGRLIIALVTATTILLCTLPMSLSPTWNGENPEHRNQYEVLAESILNGHVSLDYGDMDPRLLELDNPYNPALRNEADVFYHWDHAFYNGHYYMYSWSRADISSVFALSDPYRNQLDHLPCDTGIYGFFYFGDFCPVLFADEKISS